MKLHIRQIEFQSFHLSISCASECFEIIQSSQVDLLAKSEMFDGVAVVFDAEGVTPLGGFGGMLPQKILKN